MNWNQCSYYPWCKLPLFTDIWKKNVLMNRKIKGFSINIFIGEKLCRRYISKLLNSYFSSFGRDKFLIDDIHNKPAENIPQTLPSFFCSSRLLRETSPSSWSVPWRELLQIAQSMWCIHAKVCGINYNIMAKLVNCTEVQM